MMKKVLLLLLVVFSYGCKSPLDDILDNKFSLINPTTPEREYVGVWTGSSGPYLLTINVNSNGYGYYCSSWNERNYLGKIKYYNKSIFFQDGTSIKLSINNNSVIGTDNYSKKDIYFVHDNELIEASPYCSKHIK
ncbi:hypothetical protein I6M38_11400 [Shewanella algae]|uniref:J517_1871 family lipoprotein n=1 Tax=Shewanella algae TaxID=38313 RepID=UPI001AAD0901|nr:J517_1871 family lipoprotein [Shewanella algae]MBO2552584.1 hypothetical protein [Shewanella algae]